jgi:hypothetical protein
VNRPPVITAWGGAPPRLSSEATAVLRAAASDPDGDPLRFAYKAERGAIAVDPAGSGTVRYTPPQDGSPSDSVTVTVTDAAGLSAAATTRIALDTIAPAAAPRAEPTAAPPPPAATAVPVARRASPTPLPAAPPAPAPTVRAAAATPPPPAPTPRRRTGNHAPILQPGTTIDSIGNASVVLEANGYDPDGDSVDYKWDTKGCFDVLQESQSSAEVRFNYCTWGVIRLTWTDPEGLSAFAEWTISK